MNKSAFLKLIQQIASISDQQTEELEKVAATFPYFQTAHLLLAKSAHDKGSMLSTQRLRRASAYATNRQLLKQIIYTSPAPAPAFDETTVEKPEHSIIEQEAAALPVVIDEVPEDNTSVYHTTTETSPVEEVAVEATEITATDEPLHLQETYQTEQEIAETEVDTGTETASAPTSPAVESYPYTNNTAAEEIPEEAEEELPVAQVQLVEPDENILEQPMEKLDSELALLLTIKSLSPSFTDLLAQKPDEPAPTALPASDLPQQDEIEAEPAAEKVLESPSDLRELQVSDDLEHLYSTETSSAATTYYTLEEDDQTLPDTLHEPETEPVPEV
ncbi:MAG: hypothetical protein LPK03_07850, partial [Pontibacter sp.]|nr:hypothetical protein [Pontibacter sp.]